jgi:hypothetical protein
MLVVLNRNRSVFCPLTPCFPSHIFIPATAPANPPTTEKLHTCPHRLWHGCGAADSILGVSLFAEESPVDFGRFDQAFITMFRITAGETVSLPSLPMINAARGVVDYRIALFTISYVSIVIWVLLQVERQALSESSELF